MSWNDALNSLQSAVLDTFGQAVTVNGMPISATFERRYIEIPSGEIMQAGYAPILECLEADGQSVGLDYGAAVTISTELASQDYTVVGLQPDGAGWLVAILEEA